MTTLRTDSTHSGITIDYADDSGFVHGGSGPLTVYSDDEKAAINALTDSDDDTYYMFLVNSVTKLDANGNRTIVSGYMPVGYQHGFIFEQFDVARTYAHELSHGAFALHHTFSENSESFHANEGTTNNLMDYTQSGITLNHKQWTWMHEKHGAGLFGFLADESEGESVLDNLVHYYLQEIHYANVHNKDTLNLLVENGSIETNENYRGIHYTKMFLDGGLEKLPPQEIDLLKQKIKKRAALTTEHQVTIDPKERTMEQDGTEFVKYSFHKVVKGEKTRDIAVQIVGESNNIDSIDYFLYGILPFTDLKLYEGTKEKAKDAIMYITAEPEPIMPDVRVSVKSNYKIQMQLKIEYTARKSWNEKDANGNIINQHVNELVRNDITYFPDDNADSWKDLKSEEIWDIDFGDKFRGGRAVVYCKINNQIADSIVFHIRGKNPQLTTVLTYAQTIDASWYVPKIIRQESSGTGSIGKQFNTGTPSATNQINGMPNWGYPYGWGIKQLDNFDSSIAYYTSFNNRWGASPDELWNWKLNVKKGLQLFSSKLTKAQESWNSQLENLEEWLKSHKALDSYPMKIESSTIDSEKGKVVDEIIAGSGSNTETIVSEENPQGNNRSLIEADAIRRYNGGTYVNKLYVPKPKSDETPTWIITKKNSSNLDYVNEVCGKQGW